MKNCILLNSKNKGMMGQQNIWNSANRSQEKNKWKEKIISGMKTKLEGTKEPVDRVAS